MHAQWDTSFLIGMWIFVPLTAIFALIMTGGAIESIISKAGRGPWAIGTGAIGMVLCGIVSLVIWFPFSAQYNRYVPKGGTVTKIGSRFLASDTQGGGSTQKFVVTFKDGTTLGCLDTRCDNVEVGDNLRLLCERSFQWNAPQEGWDCNWVSDTKSNGQVIP